MLGSVAVRDDSPILRADQPVYARSHALLAGLLPVLLLLPFLNKAYHIDDYVYLKVAQQIAAHPADFYGFEINWGQRYRSVADINKNPPGVSYFIAAVGSWTGWREWPLHLWFLLPTFLAGVGTYRLAGHFTQRPLTAALAAGLTPAFLVSSSNLMCEPLLLAFYVWGVERWVTGLRTGRRSAFITAGLLIGAGTLTKYLVLTAVPLLAAYTIAYERRVGRRLNFLWIPLAVVTAYDVYYYATYGMSAWLWTGSFALRNSGLGKGSEVVAHALVNLSFLGGAFLTPFLLIAVFRPRATMVAAAVLTLVAIYVLGRGGLDANYGLYGAGGIRWGYLAHLALFVAAGATLLGYTVVRWYRIRDAGALLVLLWIGGMFVFSGYVNWSINVRALLPAAPALGILAAQCTSSSSVRERFLLLACLVVGATISLAVLHGDYFNAESGRQAGVRADAILHEGAAVQPAGKLFQGHLGFQWYLEAAGFEHIVIADTPASGHLFASLSEYGFRNGDVCVVKEDAAIINLNTPDCRILEAVESSDARWSVTMNPRARAGFYTAYMGELPYYFGNSEPEKVVVYQVIDAEARP